MFGNGKNPFEHMVEKNQWDKINAKLSKANVQTKVEIAEACGHSSEDESMNILIRLLTDADEGVQLQAINSLGASGRNSTKTHLQWLNERLPESKANVKQAIKAAVSSITNRNKN